MEARSIEYEMAMGWYQREQREMEALLGRILGQEAGTGRPLSELRREVQPRMEGVSASRMIIEAR